MKKELGALPDLNLLDTLFLPPIDTEFIEPDDDGFREEFATKEIELIASWRDNRVNRL